MSRLKEEAGVSGGADRDVGEEGCRGGAEGPSSVEIETANESKASSGESWVESRMTTSSKGTSRPSAE
jgi:hypothetical protein